MVGVRHFENLPRVFALARIWEAKRDRMRWKEMEEDLRWFKHLHQPESIAKAFIECGRSFRGDTDAIGMNKATYGSNSDSNDF